MNRPAAIVVAACLLLMAAPAWADEPDWCQDGYLCIQENKARKVRDRARSYELVCEQLASPPSEVRQLCADAANSARRWVRSQKYKDAQAAADKAQRKANRREGQVQELRGFNDDLQLRVETLAADKRQARNSRNMWRWIAGGTGTAAVVSTVVWVGDLVGWWNL